LIQIARWGALLKKKKSLTINILCYLSTPAPIQSYITICITNKKDEVFFHIPIVIKVGEELKQEYLADPISRYCHLDNSYISDSDKKSKCTVFGIHAYPIPIKSIPKYMKINSAGIWPALGITKTTIFYLKSGSISNNISKLSDIDKTKLIYFVLSSLCYLYDTLNTHVPYVAKIPIPNDETVDLPMLEIKKSKLIHDYSNIIWDFVLKIFGKQINSIETPGITNLLKQLDKNYHFLIPTPLAYLSEINDTLHEVDSKELDIKEDRVEIIDFDYE